jgi:hypothetical protein
MYCCSCGLSVDAERTLQNKIEMVRKILGVVFDGQEGTVINRAPHSDIAD